jgi:hypothetical protein
MANEKSFADGSQTTPGVPNAVNRRGNIRPVHVETNEGPCQLEILVEVLLIAIVLAEGKMPNRRTQPKAACLLLHKGQ